MALPQNANLIRHWHVNSGLYTDAGTTAAGVDDAVLQWHDVVASYVTSQPSVNTSCPTLQADGLYFDGDDFLDGAVDIALGSGARTVVVLARHSGNSGKLAIMTLNSVILGSGQDYMLTSETGVRVLNGSRIFGSNPLSTTAFQQFAASNPDGADASNVSGYLDGVALSPTSTSSRGLNTSGSHVRIGGSAQGGSYERFEGTIKAIAVWDVELTAAEIAGITEADLVPTAAPPSDTTPDPFTFNDVIDAALSTPTTSNTITVTGIDAAAAISVDVGEYSINNGAFTSASGTVNVNDTVQGRVTSSASNSTGVTQTVTIGGVTDSWTVTTEAPAASDTTPDAFTFTDVAGAALSTVTTSNTITVTGIDAASTLTITGGEYSVNSGAFASTSTTVNANDTVQLRVTSSANNATSTSVTLTIGGVSDVWTVTTEAAPVVPVSELTFEPALNYPWRLDSLPGLTTQGSISITTSGTKIYRGFSNRTYGQMQVSTLLDVGSSADLLTQVEAIETALASVTHINIGAFRWQVVKVMQIDFKTEQGMKQDRQVRVSVTLEVGERETA